MVNDKSSNADIKSIITDSEGGDTPHLPYKNLTSHLMRYETGEASEEEVVKLFQYLIDSKMAWQLQGHYGRMAAHLIEQGVCDDKSSQ